MTLYAEALATFDALFAQARDAGIPEPTAMTVATADRDGRPAARMALLKAHDERGFVFYTHLDGRKGRELQANPQCALLFFWKALGEDTFLDATQARSVAAVLVPTALYLGSMHWVGLLAGSAALIAWFMKRHGGFGWGLTALIALGVPTLVHLVFERGFLVLLPRGVWVEALLTRLGAG